MTFAVGKVGAEYLFGFFVDYDLAFKGVALLLAGVVSSLPFFGRSIGVSVASIKTTSISSSDLSRAFLPGKAKHSSLIRVSSTHRQIL